jgi:diaminopimelate decarboxylase
MGGFMNCFQYVNDELYAEELAIQEVVSQVGTPVYIYSQQTLQQHFTAYDSAFGDINHLTCFTVKTNANQAILKLLGSMGAGAEVSSGEELCRVLKSDILPEKIIYAGVGRSRQEMEYALQSGILLFKVETLMGLELLNKVAERLNMVAPIALRINPNIAEDIRPSTATALRRQECEVLNMQIIIEKFKQAISLKHVEVVGAYIDTEAQFTQTPSFADSFHLVLALIRKLQEEGIQLRYIDIGDGLGIAHQDEFAPSPQEFLQAISSIIYGLHLKIITESGRLFLGNAGILVTRVSDVSKKSEENHLPLDVKMSDLTQSGLHKTYRKVFPIQRKNQQAMQAGIGGLICDLEDIMSLCQKLPESLPGESVAITSADADCSATVRDDNSWPRISEVLVKGNQFLVIQEREADDAGTGNI